MYVCVCVCVRARPIAVRRGGACVASARIFTRRCRRRRRAPHRAVDRGGGGAHTTTRTRRAQLEHLQSKYAGTGHADVTKFEWAVNMKRDSYASYIGHDSLMCYLAVAYNEPKERLRCRFLKVRRAALRAAACARRAVAPTLRVDDAAARLPCAQDMVQVCDAPHRGRRARACVRARARDGADDERVASRAASRRKPRTRRKANERACLTLRRGRGKKPLLLCVFLGCVLLSLYLQCPWRRRARYCVRVRARMCAQDESNALSSASFALTSERAARASASSLPPILSDGSV